MSVFSRNSGYAVLIALSFPLCVQAQQSPFVGPRAVKEALAQAAAHSPDPDVTVAVLHERLRASSKKLDEFLVTSGVQDGWNRLLGLPALKSELSHPQPDLKVFNSIAERFCQDYRGLELPEFLAVRRDLRGYIAAREYAAAPKPRELFGERVAELQQCLTRLHASYGDVDAHRAGALIAWLEPLGPEGARIAETVRPQYCRVNAFALVSSRAANMLLERQVEEQNFITDTILGTFTQGPAYVNAQISVGLVPRIGQSCLEIRVNGLIDAPATVAQRRNVTVHSSSQTTLTASKQVLLSEQGLEFLPAAATAASSAQLRDVEASRRIVERMAWRRAGRMLPEAEQLVSRKAEAESSSKLNDQAASMLHGANELICQTLRAPLVRKDAFPVTHFSSSADQLQIRISQWNPSQLAPASPAPKFPADYDLAFGAHESMVSNLAESLLCGMTVHDEEWRKLVDLMTGESPRPLWVHERAERWSTTFAKDRPLVARFEKDRASFTLRLAKVTRGERQFEQPLEVTAQFRLKTSDQEGPFLIREGELEIQLAPGLAADDEAELRKFLSLKMGAVLPPELHFDGFVPPAGGTIGRLRSLKAMEFASRDGWLTLGYKIEHTSTLTVASGK